MFIGIFLNVNGFNYFINRSHVYNWKKGLNMIIYNNIETTGDVWQDIHKM